MGNFVGIDLGTTNSVAAFKLAELEVVTADGNTQPDKKLTKSVVACDQGKIIVVILLIINYVQIPKM